MSGKTKAVTGVDSLSKRQKEILRLVARHHQIKEIARLLDISEATVRTHTEEARRRLGAPTSREAAIALLRHESSDGALSGEGLLPDTSRDAHPQMKAASEQTTGPDPVTEPEGVSPAQPQWVSDWLGKRSMIECLGIILLIALGLTVVLVALLTSTATFIQAIHNITGQSH